MLEVAINSRLGNGTRLNLGFWVLLRTYRKAPMITPVYFSLATVTRVCCCPAISADGWSTGFWARAWSVNRWIWWLPHTTAASVRRLRGLLPKRDRAGCFSARVTAANTANPIRRWLGVFLPRVPDP